MRLTVSNLCVNRGERQILSGIGFTLSDGEVLVITGKNGAGKSTLLKSLAGLLASSEGTVELEGGEEGAGIAEQCHYLGHDNALKPALSVRENLAFWRDYLGSPASIEEGLEIVGMSGSIDIPVAYLSAGQKRRIALARMLVSRRAIWLADEPTAALDQASSRRFADMVRHHVKGGGMVIAATHLDLGIKSARSMNIEARPEESR
ncbi:MAG: heme ABC exporter ATP-binding protein CcmA [Rhizobiaceae bacterium]